MDPREEPPPDVAGPSSIAQAYAPTAVAPASWLSTPLAFYAWAFLANAVAAAFWLGLVALAAAYGVWSPILLATAEALFSATAVLVALLLVEHHRRAGRRATALFAAAGVLALISAAAPWIAMRAPVYGFVALAVCAASSFAQILALRRSVEVMTPLARPEPHPHPHAAVEVAPPVDLLALVDRAARLTAVGYGLWAIAGTLALATEQGDLGWSMMLRFADAYVVAEAVAATHRLARHVAGRLRAGVEAAG
jgi:hypothetical protein